MRNFHNQSVRYPYKDTQPDMRARSASTIKKENFIAIPILYATALQSPVDKHISAHPPYSGAVVDLTTCGLSSVP